MSATQTLEAPARARTVLPELLTYDEAAERVGCCTVTLRREAADGRLRVTRLRGKHRIQAAHLVDWIEACSAPARAA